MGSFVLIIDKFMSCKICLSAVPFVLVLLQ